MFVRIRMPMLLSLLALLPAGGAGPAWGATQPPAESGLRPLVEEVLDQPARGVEVKDQPLADALAQLEKQTGLQFVLSPRAMERMPYGERTRISVALDGVTLRKGLARVFDGLGLMMRIEGDKLLVEEAPVLERMGRRLTISEIELLGELATQKWAEASRSVRVAYQMSPEENPRDHLQVAAEQTAEPNAVRQLEIATGMLGWLWAVQDDAVVIFTRRDDVLYRLDRPLDLAYQRITLDELLVDLAARAGVDVSIEPGALRRIQASERVVDLVQRQTSVRQVLERISGNTGLRWEATNDGLRIMGPSGAAAAGAAPSGDDPVVAIVELQVDGKKVQFPFRASEVSEQLRALRGEALAELERLAASSFRPSDDPARREAP